MRVPTGTLRTVGLPVVPDMLEPRPWPPRSDFHSGLKRKWTKVLWLRELRMRMSPPWPPSPPEGPPRGTNFSRRKAMQPLPPSPAFMRIVASSMNMRKLPELPRLPNNPNWDQWREFYSIDFTGQGVQSLELPNYQVTISALNQEYNLDSLAILAL